MSRLSWLLMLLVLPVAVLGGCGGGGTSGSPVPVPSGLLPTPTPAPTTTPVPTATPTLSSQELYVENTNSNSVNFGVFPSNAVGSPPPTRTITVTGVGTLPAGQNGAPVQGARVGVAFPSAAPATMAVGNAGQILQFPAPTASGAVAATATSTITSTSLQAAIPGLSYDASGNLYAATFNPITGGNAAIVVFPAGSNGNVASPRIISSTQMGSQSAGGVGDPEAVAVDSKGNIYVALFPLGGSNAASIVVFSSSASGPSTPVQFIQGSNTGLPTAASTMSYMDLAVDAAQNIYVVYSTPTNAGILVFGTGANGNVAPVRSVTSTQSPSLSGTSGITLDVNTNAYVVNQATSTLQFYGAGVNTVSPISNVGGFSTGIFQPLAVRFGP